MSERRVGLIGVGNMGLPMAQRMLDCGVQPVVFDRNPQAYVVLAQQGVRAAATPREMADECEIIVTSMPSREASLEVATGEHGVAGGRALRVYVETSTLGSETVERIADPLRAHGIGMLDAPVSGGPPGARAGSLALLVSGAQADFDLARPLLDILGTKVFFLGAKPGISQVAKLINNHVSAAGRVAVFEGLAMGIKAGIDPKTLNDVFNAGSARNYTTTDKVPAAILTGLFKFNGPLAIGLKDEALLLEEARRCNAPLWLAPRILEIYEEAAAAGYRLEDGMRLFQYMQMQERESG